MVYNISPSMASIHYYSVSVPPIPKLPNPNKIRIFSTNLSHPNRFPCSMPTFCSSRTRASSSPSSIAVGEADKPDEQAMSIENLHRFIDLCIGKWNGSFFQFDASGNLLHKISTKLAASSYGENELISLIQTLYIKQSSSSTTFSGYDDKPEWAEYKIKETNIFTADKYQQIGFFPSERAFSLRYQTAGMLETVIRQGVLGEDDTGEESPRNLCLPSRRPSIVCENCLYSLEKDMRARAFHIMDPKGIIQMLLVFLEERSDGVQVPLFDNSTDVNRIMPFVGTWKGNSITKRSGVYGATISEADTVALLEIDDNSQLIQDLTSTSKGDDITTKVHWTGSISENLITFDGGYQMTLLPGGMYMGYPCDVSKSVAESKSFHLEFCWFEAPDKRQRLTSTFLLQWRTDLPYSKLARAIVESTHMIIVFVQQKGSLIVRITVIKDSEDNIVIRCMLLQFL